MGAEGRKKSKSGYFNSPVHLDVHFDLGCPQLQVPAGGPFSMAPLLLELSSAPGDLTLPTTSPRLGVLMAPLLLPVLGSSPSWSVPLTVPTPLLQHSICFLPGPFLRQLYTVDWERSSITPRPSEDSREKQDYILLPQLVLVLFPGYFSNTQVTTVPLPMLTSFQLFYPWSHSQLPHFSKALDYNVAKSY